MDLNQSEFNDLINEVESDFAKACVTIPKRPISAILSIAKKSGLEKVLIAYPHIPNYEFPVNRLNLCDHVHNWYGNQYGDKLNIDPSPGRFPVLIEGHCYECRLPLLIGKREILSSKHVFEGKEIVNGVDYIVDLPNVVRNRLSGKLECELNAMFVTSLEVGREIARNKTPLIQSANTDMLVSSDLICGFHVNSSMSAWHSLQFAEKVLKQFISKHKEPPHSHKIDTLAKIAENHGYVPDPNIKFDVFKFGASTRYSPLEISTEESVKINYEAWRISYNVLKQYQA